MEINRLVRVTEEGSKVDLAVDYGSELFHHHADIIKYLIGIIRRKLTNKSKVKTEFIEME